MRTAILALMCFCLQGCIGWTGASDLQFADKSNFAGEVTANGGCIVLGKGCTTGGPVTLSVEDCFDPQKRESEKTSNLFPTIGANPFKRVCRQYEGVNLARQPLEAIECFDPVEGEQGHKTFKHPWLSQNPSPLCESLVAEIEAGRIEEQNDG